MGYAIRTVIVLLRFLKNGPDPVPVNMMGGQLSSCRGEDKALFELLFFTLQVILIRPSPTSSEVNEKTPADFNGSWIGPIVLC